MFVNASLPTPGAAKFCVSGNHHRAGKTLLKISGRFIDPSAMSGFIALQFIQYILEVDFNLLTPKLCEYRVKY